MSTKAELTAMKTMPLRRLAAELNVPNYGNMDNDALIAAILAAQKLPAGKIEVQYTDRHEMPIGEGSPVSVRIGIKWLKGTMTKGKIIEDEQYVYVQLEGTDKAKMFHTSEVEVDKVAAAKMPAPKPAIEKSYEEEVLVLGDKMVEVPIEKEPEAEPTMGPSKEISGIIMGLRSDFEATKKPAATVPTPKPAATPKPVIATAKVGENNGFPITKHHDHLKDIDLQGITKDSPVKFLISKTSKVNPGSEVQGIVKSFVWDTQDKSAYFTILVDGKLYYKKPSAVEKL